MSDKWFFLAKHVSRENLEKMFPREEKMTLGALVLAYLKAHGDTGREELAALVQPYCSEGTSAYTALEALRREGLIHSTGDGTLRLGAHPKHARPKNFWGFAV